MLVLASSRKHGGRCIAGVALDRDALLRPVSPAGTGELVPGDCLPGWAYPRELDVVTFGHNGHDGDKTQPENLVIDGTPWASGLPLTPAQVWAKLTAVEHRAPRLFGNRGRAVHVDDTAGGVDASLLVIQPDGLTLAVTDERKARARFTHAGVSYDLGITDVEVGPLLRQRVAGTYSFVELGLPEPQVVFLLLSLSLPLELFHHKLVAGIVRL